MSLEVRTVIAELSFVFSATVRQTLGDSAESEALAFIPRRDRLLLEISARFFTRELINFVIRWVVATVLGALKFRITFLSVKHPYFEISKRFGRLDKGGPARGTPILKGPLGFWKPRGPGVWVLLPRSLALLTVAPLSQNNPQSQAKKAHGRNFSSNLVWRALWIFREGYSSPWR